MAHPHRTRSVQRNPLDLNPLASYRGARAMNLLADSVVGLITSFTRLITGAQARWIGCSPAPVQRIYYANHTSHADFVLIWASLPPHLRRITRPVAGADYWGHGAVKQFIIHEVLRGVLIDRDRVSRLNDPVRTIVSALEGGDSLIVFPEGTRNTTDEPLLPLKSGLYRVACGRPDVQLVPVWMENLGRVLPSGEVIPVPLLCSINFGSPFHITPGEQKTGFMNRARGALVELAASLKPQ